MFISPLSFTLLHFLLLFSPLPPTFHPSLPLHHRKHPSSCYCYYLEGTSGLKLWIYTPQLQTQKLHTHTRCCFFWGSAASALRGKTGSGQCGHISLEKVLHMTRRITATRFNVSSPLKLQLENQMFYFSLHHTLSNDSTTISTHAYTLTATPSHVSKAD